MVRQRYPPPDRKAMDQEHIKTYFLDMDKSENLFCLTIHIYYKYFVLISFLPPSERSEEVGGRENTFLFVEKKLK